MGSNLPCKLQPPFSSSSSSSSNTPRCCRCGKVRWPPSLQVHRSSSSPLKPAELQVLRSQYEKEGDYVGIQTKFNFAWVRYSRLLSARRSSHSPVSDLMHTSPGSDQIQRPCRTTRRCPPALRDLPRRPGTSTRMSLLPRARKLQTRQLRRGPALQRLAAGKGAGQPAGGQSGPAHR